MRSPVGSSGRASCWPGRGVGVDVERVGERGQREQAVVGRSGQRVDLAAGRGRASSPSPGRRRTTPAPWRRRGRGGGPLRAAWSRTRRGTRCGRPGTRPAPRSMRVGNVSHRSLAPVVSAIERASASDASRHAVPPTSSTAGSPDRSTCAIAPIASSPIVPARRGCLGCGDLAALAPRDVGGQDQRRDLTGRTVRGGHRVGRVGADLAGLRRPADEPRHVARHRLDVGLELRVVLLVVRRVVADDVDDRRLTLARVVQVGEPVAEARPEVQQRGRGPVGHAAVAVGRAGGDAFEQREHAAHLGHRVERGDEVHLRRAGVHEAGVDTARDERADECLGAVHDVSSSSRPAHPNRRSCRG